MLVLLLALACASSAADPPLPLAPASLADAGALAWTVPQASPFGLALAESARDYLGRPYTFGGRGKTLDCMGLVFRAWTDAGGGPWRSLSVNPTELVAGGSLGVPVPGASPVPSAAIVTAPLTVGDVLFFLTPKENPAEPSLVALDGTPLWVWHMGLYAGGDDKTFVVGDHFAGRVVETELSTYLEAHPEYVAVYAVRAGIGPAAR